MCSITLDLRSTADKKVIERNLNLKHLTSRHTQNYISTKHIETIKYQSITSNQTKNRHSFAPSPPRPHSLLLSPSLFFFLNYYDIFG
jgi:hypothetical protein